MAEPPSTRDLSQPTVEIDGAAALPLDVRVPAIPNYRVLGFLGEGGMGRVFSAIDERLQRPVALKILKGDDRALAGRLLGEARSQARIEHDNVCKVFEAGEAGGQAFVAMQLLRGRSLAEEAGRLIRDQKVLVVRDAADAVHAAHRLGLVHRDLKPANIIVEPAEGGRLHAYVVDFGLAREVDTRGQTATGVLLGTPWFMSPEQARGDSRAVDRRSDVYSLGATLYAVLAGRPPFASESVYEVLTRVVTEDPTPLRAIDPSIPEDLATVVMKCLEKDPARRYASARELRDDLTRYLDGDPVQARRASLAYRWTRRARKHRAVVSTAAVALVALTATGVTALRTRLAAAEHARVARQLGAGAERIEWLVRAAHQSPLHDVRPQLQLVRATMGGFQQQAREDASASAAYLALGRGHLALGDAREGLVALQQAWDLGERGADEAALLGAARTRLYVDELRDAARLGDAALQATRRRELRQKHLEPALGLLKRAGASQLLPPEYVEALVAAHDGRAAEVGPLVERALARLPWLYEALVVLGDVQLEVGRQARMSGAYDEATARLREAAETYGRAAAIGRSAAVVHEAECATWAELMYVENDLGRDPTDAYRRSTEACGRARTANAASAGAWHHLSFAEWQWGQHLLETDRSPVAALQASIRASEMATRLRPDWAEAHNYHGIAHGYLARGAMARGEDARPLTRTAIASIDRALALDPRFAYAHTTRGLGLYDLAREAQRWGGDARPFLDQAIVSHRRAIELSPGWLFPLANLGDALLARGKIEAGDGGEADLAAAVAAIEQVIERGDRSRHAQARLDEARGRLAEVQRRHR